jgi:hypothetical protein
MPVPKLSQVDIAVQNMDQMAGFYERLRMQLAAPPDWAAHLVGKGVQAPPREDGGLPGGFGFPIRRVFPGRGIRTAIEENGITTCVPT